MLVHADNTAAVTAAASPAILKTDGIAPPVLDVEIEYTLADLSHYYRAVNVDKQYTDAAAMCIMFICFLLIGAAKGFASDDWAAGLLCSVLTLPLLYYVLLPVTGPRSWYKQYKGQTKNRIIISENGVRLVAPNTETSYNWAYFAIGWEDAQMLCISNATHFSVMVPRRFFNGDAQQEAEVRTLLLRHIPAWTDLRTVPSGRLRREMERAKKEAQ